MQLQLQKGGVGGRTGRPAAERKLTSATALHSTGTIAHARGADISPFKSPSSI